MPESLAPPALPDLKLAERAQFRIARALDLLPPRVQLALAGRRELETEGEELDPGVALILRTMAASGVTSLTLGGDDVALMRETVAAATRVSGRPTTRVASVEDLEIEGAAGPLRARLYRPPGAQERPPLLVYLHGGGYVVGDLDSHDEPCRIFCRHGGAVVLAVDYRLAPEHPFPAAADDAEAALRWALSEADALGCDPQRVAIGGDSAGANLAAVASQRAPEGSGPAVQLLIYPGLQADEDTPSRERFAEGYYLTLQDIHICRDLYVPDDVDRSDPRVSPIRQGELSGLPAAIVVTAAFDPLRDEGEEYARMLEGAGVPVTAWRAPGLIHGFISLTNVNRASRDATIAIAGALRSALDSAPAAS